jgi:hypothetical protein
MHLKKPLSALLSSDSSPEGYAALVNSGFIVSGAAPAGFNERADAVLRAADGSDLNDFWDEVNESIRLRNAQRNRLVDLLTFRVTELAEEVTLPGAADFEKASEYGLPKGIRTTVSRFWRGYSFDFYDLALRYTWMFIASANIAQLRTLNNTALEADNRLVFNQVMKTLFNSLNGTGITDQNIPVTVYKFYNGDGEVPPPYKNITHAGSHNHYLTTQGLAASATLTPAGVEAMSVHLDHHGYTFESGYRKVLWVNKQEADIIKTWRVAGGAPWDFIPTVGYGGGVYLPNDQGRLVNQPQGNLPGQIGTYGPWHVVQEDYIPAGYLVGIVTGGPNNITNPIGVREHQNPAFRGLNIMPGNRSDYPLIESYYQRGLGTGIRHRGAGIVAQVSGNASYTIPAIYA